MIFGNEVFAEGVECTDDRFFRGFGLGCREFPQDSGFHLFNGFSVESNGEDMRGWDVVGLDEVQDPCGYDCGFAAAGGLR